MFRGLLVCSLLLAAAVGAEELPVRDPMRPFGSIGATAGTPVARPRFALTAVLISTARRVAVINGKPYQQQQLVDGAELVAIEPTVVRLREHGIDHVVVLGRPAAGTALSQGESAP